MHTAKDLLSIAAGILEGEIQRMAGDLPAAIASFQRAADIQDALAYDEPEPLPFAAHHWLGAALLESKRFEDAEKVYRADLKEHPRNGWSLLGLQQALAGQGDAFTDRSLRNSRRAGRAPTPGSGPLASNRGRPSQPLESSTNVLPFPGS